MPLRQRVRALSLRGMNPARATDAAYIDFLIASPVVVSATEAARVQPAHPLAPAHDSFTRLLHRLEPDPDELWAEVRPLIRPTAGVLVIDDTTLDKPRAKSIDLVCRHWSGNHHAVVRGINLITALWSDGDRLYPTDYRVYDKVNDGKTKNDHFADLLAAAHARGFRPRAVLFDGWYASLENLRRVRDRGWTFVTRFKGTATCGSTAAYWRRSGRSRSRRRGRWSGCRGTGRGHSSNGQKLYAKPSFGGVVIE
jgi:putative transposase